MKYLIFSLLLCGLSFGLSAPTFSQDAEYEVKFEGLWPSSLPTSGRPGNAHFTTLVGATHNANGSLFTIGQQASLGVEGVAETGATGNFVNEINAGRAAGTIDNGILDSVSFNPPEATRTFNITANNGHSLLTLITMIAPSPDWFVGVHDLDLQDSNGLWRSSIVMDLNSYDAGTENGTTLTLSGAPTNPRGNITLLDTAEPNNVLFGSSPIARLTLTRISAVPEPGSFIVLTGLGICLAARRRR